MKIKYFICRYAYIFWLKNPTAFHDDFWYLFICLWVFATSVYLQANWILISSYLPMSYYMCTGTDPEMSFLNPPKIYGWLEVPSALLIIVLYTKVYFFKRKLFLSTLTFADKFEKHSVSTVVNNMFVFLYIGLSNYIAVILNNTQPKDLNFYPYNKLSYFRSLVSTTLCFLLLVTTCVTNKKYHRIVLEELQILIFSWIKKIYR